MNLTDTPLVQQHDDLYALAIELTYQAFERPSDAHIETVYERLQMGAIASEPCVRAVTVH